jgi:hypothetical protein
MCIHNKPRASRMRRYKRKAASKVFLFLFSALGNLSFQLTFNHLEWGEDIFTPKEQELIAKLRLRLHQEGEVCRQMGQRLCK